jgi:hypothetical protein
MPRKDEEMQDFDEEKGEHKSSSSDPVEKSHRHASDRYFFYSCYRDPALF